MSEQVWAEVVTIGSELVLGQLVDTNAAYIARALSEIGVGLARHTTVGDDRTLMIEAMSAALDRCQVVITTGGMGPTEDDLTREAAAAVLGRPLVFHQDLLDHIEKLFRRIGYRMPENNRRQAYIPEGAAIIHNPRGTAPCFLAENGGRVLVCLPGVPKETEPLIHEAVIPFLLKKYELSGHVWINRTFKVCGLGESAVDSQIRDLIVSSKNPIIGLQAAPGEVKVRLTARGETREEADRLLDGTEAEVRAILGPLIFGTGDETLAGNTARLLQEKGLSVTVVEAMTRGAVSAELGEYLAPALFKGGLILDKPAPAGELCQKALEGSEADLALAVAGFPLENGQFRVEFMVRARGGGESFKELTFGGARHIVQQRANIMTLFTLLRYLRD